MGDQIVTVPGGIDAPGALPGFAFPGAPTFGQVNSGTPSIGHFAGSIPWANPDSVPGAPTPMGGVGTMAEANFPGAGAITGRLATDMSSPSIDNAVYTLNDVPSNWMINIPRKIISYKNRAFQMPLDGQVVFAVRDRDASFKALTGHPANAARRAHAGQTLRSGTAAGAHRIGVFNMPQWNWLSASSERKVGPYEHVMTAEERWANWTIEGFVRYEEGNFNRWGQEEDPRAEKTLTSTVHGIALTHNVHNNRLEAGDRLWFKLVRQARSTLPKTMALSAKGTMRMATTPAAELTDHPFQLVPWAKHGCGRPSMEDLRYVDDYGRNHQGKALYVGRVDTPERMSDEDYMESAKTDTAALVQTGKLWIFLDPDH